MRILVDFGFGVAYILHTVWNGDAYGDITWHAWHGHIIYWLVEVCVVQWLGVMIKVG